MTDWQPIDTVPKDGTPVDLWVYGESEEAEFHCGRDFMRPRKNGGWEGRVTNMKWEDGWRPCVGLTRMMKMWMTPTHWMPLPEPPEADR